LAFILDEFFHRLHAEFLASYSSKLVTNLPARFNQRAGEKQMQQPKHAGGRPPVYSKRVRRHIATLIRRHGLTGAMRRLNALAEDKLSTERNINIVPEPLGISMPTLGKIKREFGLTVKQGRPKKNF